MTLSCFALSGPRAYIRGMSIRIDRPDNAKSWDFGVRVRIDYDACESTGVCAMVCPESVFEHRDGHTHVVNQAACTSCWICVENCIAGAIEIS
jgi:Pyruvate/2-oxoacid:ferredoxin oxidoreductase delta subunit